MRLWGSDIDYSTNKFTALVSDLNTAGCPYLDIEVTALNGKPIREAGIIEFFGSKKQLVTQYYGMTPESKMLPYSAATNAYYFYGMNVTNKTYNYVSFDTSYGTYGLLPNGFQLGTDALMLNISEIEYVDDAEQASKGINLTLESLIQC
jgi:hypothetical protein